MSKNDELRKKSAEELNKELLELRRAQFGLRMQLATQSLTTRPVSWRWFLATFWAGSIIWRSLSSR